MNRTDFRTSQLDLANTARGAVGLCVTTWTEQRDGGVTFAVYSRATRNGKGFGPTTAARHFGTRAQRDTFLLGVWDRAAKRAAAT